MASEYRVTLFFPLTNQDFKRLRQLKWQYLVIVLCTGTFPEWILKWIVLIVTIILFIINCFQNVLFIKYLLSTSGFW